MKIELDLNDYHLNEKQTYYNFRVYDSKDRKGVQIALEYFDDVDQVDVMLKVGEDWVTLLSADYYHDFDHEKPITGILGDVWG